MTWDRMAPGAPLRLVPLMVLVVLGLVSALDPALEEAAARDPDPEAAAREYLRELDHDTGVHLNRASLAEWAYASNLTEHNLKRKLEVSAEVAAFQKEAWHRTVHFPWQTFRDPDLRRQFRKYSVLGSAALPPEKFEKVRATPLAKLQPGTDIQMPHIPDEIC
ncbi:uncharacterized protein GBIM_14303 [Gryllus bimaculatus]|nr:uncharacterized protein GBIM_14303 [Gryllus bimaculatus]